MLRVAPNWAKPTLRNRRSWPHGSTTSASLSPKLGFAFRTVVEKVKNGELTAEDKLRKRKSRAQWAAVRVLYKNSTHNMGLGTKNWQKQTADICKQHLREKRRDQRGLVEECISEFEGAREN